MFWNITPRKTYSAILVFALCSCFVFISTVYRGLNTDKIFNFKNDWGDVEDENRERKFIVDTPGCKIPFLDPFDPEVRKLYYHPRDKKCPRDNVLASANRTHIFIDMNKAVQIHGENVVCGYKRVWRGGNGNSDDYYGIDSSYLITSDSMKIVDEFINIGCGVNRQVVYTDFFPFIQTKNEVERTRDSKFKLWVEETEENVVERLSVTLLGVDSVSRLNMLRHMPKTFGFLTNVMNAIHLQGFTKVGDNTFVNIVPTLTGMFVDEIWNETMENEGFDYMDIVWKDFAEKGFRTLYAEEDPRSSAFNYLKSGFFQQPTDYYLRPFTVAVEERMNVEDGCYNDRTEVEVTLQWLSDFLETFKEKPTFSLSFLTRLTHEELNDAGYADEPYYDFLTKFHRSNYINNSILIFFSDHGVRFGEIRETYIGKIEERMPFYFLVFPPWFPSKYPKIWENLKINQNRLTTPFDVYATLKNVLRFTGEVKKADLNDRGISLFSEIPDTRTCEHAAILPHWCTCHERTKVDVGDVIVTNGAEKLVENINAKLAGEPQCATLYLHDIVDARVSSLNEKILKFERISDDVINQKIFYGDKVNSVLNYLITIRVKPSNALFEATVEYSESNKHYIVSDEISRINLYGNQGNCIENAVLRKFCYCKSNL